MLGSFDLSSFWKTPASIWRARKLAGRHHDVVARAAGQQLGLEDLVGVEHVVDDLDAGLLGELLDDRRIDVVRPVVDVDDLVLGLRGKRNRGGQKRRGRKQKRLANHEVLLCLSSVPARTAVLHGQVFGPAYWPFPEATSAKIRADVHGGVNGRAAACRDDPHRPAAMLPAQPQSRRGNAGDAGPGGPLLAAEFQPEMDEQRQEHDGAADDRCAPTAPRRGSATPRSARAPAPACRAARRARPESGARPTRSRRGRARD